MTTLRTARLELVPLSPDAIARLLEGDRAGAEAIVGAALPGEFPNSSELEGFLPIQLKRMRESPAQRDWQARLMIANPPHRIIGHCGFHGPPRVIGRAEIGYTVFAAYRRQG